MRNCLNIADSESSLTEVKSNGECKIPDSEEVSGLHNFGFSQTAPPSLNATPRHSTSMIPVGQLTASVISSNNVSVVRKPSESSPPARVPTPFGSVTSVLEMTEEERVTILRRNLTVMFSCIYAVLLSILGAVMTIGHHNQATRHISEIFLCTVAAIGLVWLVFFHVDLFRYKQSVLKMMAVKGEDQCDCISTCTDLNISVTWSAFDSTPYRFLQGRHSGSFYLKAGLAAFCFGHLINEGLQLGQEILNYVQEDRNSMNCGNMASIILHIIRPIYSFYQLFIVFKYSNIVINKYKEISRFALMHLLATCICFWFSTIVEDALEDYRHHMAEETKKHEISNTSQHTAGALECIENNSNSSLCYCMSHAILSVNNLQAIPYLYPFTIEFNLLLAGVWFIVWANIGKEHNHSNPHHFQHKISTTDGGIEEITYQSNLVISADCHASNKGLFAGLFLLMACIISVIVFFVAMSSKQYISLGISIHTCQEAVLTLLSLIGCLLAYWQTSQLDFNLHPITFLDDVLLFIPLPFYFAHGFLSIMAECQKGDLIRILLSAAMVIQVIVQTPFIIDGLRRCSNSRVLRYKKPGREIVTFLIVCNLTMWIVNTFEAKSVENHYGQSTYFGELIWMFIGHTTLPLMLFYRFHSSVCLADMWKSAYDKGE